ncbi:MAG TPA: M67 family metallopeptidase [Acidimicrobiales bacterium]|nr:M67 family metallopeptidase [Acidimicrobiales bacterium]
MLIVPRALTEVMVAHCLDAYPLEGCGLVAGRPGSPATAVRAYPARNAAASARVYTLEPRDMLAADRDAEAAGLEMLGVWHSHTHTEAYPSPTDAAQAPDPAWHYLIVSLRDVEPTVRSFRISGGKIEEESLVVE